MASLRTALLRELAPVGDSHMLVADPDEMLLDTELLEAIREIGYELINFEDPVAFRFSFEQHLTAGNGPGKPSLVLVRWPWPDLERAPFDLIERGGTAQFSLSMFFPEMSYPVVSALEPPDLERLYAAQESSPPGRLGETATKEYVLRHLFEIVVELIREPSHLFQVMLKRHYEGKRLPSMIDDYLISRLRRNSTFDDWPLELIVPNRDAFFAFVHERWPVFLDQRLLKEPEVIRERRAQYRIQIPGDLDLPFGDANVRVYIDNLFAESFLEPIAYSSDHLEGAGWVSVGIAASPLEDRIGRVTRLKETIEAGIPDAHARYEEWVTFALLWARMIEGISGCSDEHAPTFGEDEIHRLRTAIDASFSSWLTAHYGSLIQLPADPPVMLHHIPRYLSRVLSSDSNSRIAFLLVDGLALDQWLTLKKVLRVQDPKLILEESLVFAWIPTITSVSRQAGFSGKPPAYFPTSINTTNKEAALWAEYWETEGLDHDEILYERGLGDGESSELTDQLSDPRIRVAGLIVNKVDKIMHGMELGTAGMHNQIKQWANVGFLRWLISSLSDLDFYIYLGSDHGNIEARGIGNPREGAIAEVRGSRARIYSDELLRRKVLGTYPKAVEWPSTGLPPDFLPLIAPDREAFVNESETIVGHGGITLEEVIVPFVSISRSSDGSK